MRGLLALIVWLAVSLGAFPATAQDRAEMLIIAHRGASGERPEHTLAAYELAIDQGAHFIELDLVPTKDGVLVARHENEISGTTDVGERPEFAARLTTRVIDGQEITGWFTEDFTLAELRTLRARERLPEIRRQNTAYDGLYQVPTLAEIISLVRAKEAETGRVIGLYPEIKHPGYFASIGYGLAELLVQQLHGAGYAGEGAPVFIQSFEVTPLVRLNQMTDLRLVQLMSLDDGPADIPGRTYAEMATADGLAMIATYADGIGADMRLLFDEEAMPTGVRRAAHDSRLFVHAWTARKENAFLPTAFRRGEDLSATGCDYLIYHLLRAFEIDGVFSDNPARAIAFATQEQDDCPNGLYSTME